jgi:phosphoribosylformylglycinamidine cyclo-ligase
MLTPTRIYVRELLALHATGKLLAAAHITGGGLVGNLQRVIPAHLAPRYDFSWQVPALFTKIQRLGGVPDQEMQRVFNLGIGIAMIAHPADADCLREAGRAAGAEVLAIGELA